VSVEGVSSHFDVESDAFNRRRVWRTVVISEQKRKQMRSGREKKGIVWHFLN
jgi:hypothetical protein